MNDERFSLVEFLESNTSETQFEPDQIEALFSAAIASERPRSLKVLFWLLLRALQNAPEDFAEVIEKWLPSEADLAQLLEDVGGEGTKTVLKLGGAKAHLRRVVELCDDVGVVNLVRISDGWQVASLAPMAALFTERQLDELISAVVRERQWKDPGEILRDGADEPAEFEIEALICLGQARMIKSESNEALNVTMLRLLTHTDRVN